MKASTTTTPTQAVSRQGTSATLGRTVRKASTTILLVLAFCVLAMAGYEVKTGLWHATPVLSGSMRPGMQPGDVVVTQRVPIGDLHIRDVVVFYPPHQTAHPTVHRIVKLTKKDGTTSITTWGDANLGADPVVSSLSGTTAYRMVRDIPLLGYPAVWLQNGDRGMLAIALGVVLLIFAAVTILRPDKPSGRPESGDPADRIDPAESSPTRSSPPLEG